MLAGWPTRGRGLVLTQPLNPYWRPKTHQCSKCRCQKLLFKHLKEAERGHTQLARPACYPQYSMLVELAKMKGMTLGFVPGTGRMGSNLARLYAQAGFSVWLGSR